MKTEREIPEKLGCYAVLKEAGLPSILGKGNWGPVYKAFNSKLRCFGALRIIPQGAFADEESRRKFIGEVREATYIMGHRRVAAVFPLELIEDAYLYGSELCTGEKLTERMDRDGCLSTEMALNISGQIAEALETIGRVGLIHHRITASNIVLDEGEDESDVKIKILDLALPRASPTESSALPAPECDFRSPEETVGATADSRSVIYTIGAILYYLLEGPEKYQLFRAKSLANQPHGLDQSSAMAPGCIAILDGTLDYDPAARLQTFPELRELLDKVIDSPESFQIAQRELARNRAQEDEEARRRVQEEAARRAAEAEEQRLAELRAEQERQEAARLSAEVEEQKRKEANAQRMAELHAKQERQETKRQPRTDNKVTHQLDDGAAQGSSSWGWIVTVIVLILCGIVGFYFWPFNSVQQETANQAINSTSQETVHQAINSTSQETVHQTGNSTTQETVHQTVNPPPPLVQPTAGTLTIDTDPTGAKVTLDDKPPQTAPWTFSDVAYGPHHLLVELDGYKSLTRDLSFSGSPLTPIKLEPLPDPLQDLVGRINAAPHNSSDFLRASLDYLQLVKTQPPSRQSDPVKGQQDDKVQKDLNSALVDLENRMISLPQYQHKDVYQSLLDNKVLEDAVKLGSVPAMVMLADNAQGEREDPKAQKLFQSAASQNDRYALRSLGKIYFKLEDRISSDDYFEKARALGDAYATVSLLDYILEGKGRLPAEKAKAQKQVEHFVDDWEKAAQSGDTSVDIPSLGFAELVLAHYYLIQASASGPGPIANDLRLKATSLLRNAAEQHLEPRAYIYLGRQATAEKNYSEAESFWQKASLEGVDCRDDFAGFYLARGGRAKDDGNFSDAETYLKKGISLEPHDKSISEQLSQQLAELYLILGQQAKHAGDFSSAKAYFQKGIDYGSDSCKKELDTLTSP